MAGGSRGSSTVEIGREAEDRACAFLQARGYEIVERNVRLPVGELDVIARHEGDLVFVEIRSRGDSAHGSADETVGTKKRAQLVRVAKAYIALRQPRFSTSRFDVVAITGDELLLYADAFRPGID